jgi:hypothetical protein
MKYKITESQFKKLVETARIQPYKGVVKGQEDYSDEAYAERVGLDKSTHDSLKSMKKKYPKAKISVGKNPDYFDYHVKHDRYSKPLAQGQKEIDNIQKELTRKQREKTNTDRFSLDKLGYHNVDPNAENDVDAVNYDTVHKAISKSNSKSLYSKIENIE